MSFDTAQKITLGYAFKISKEKKTP